MLKKRWYLLFIFGVVLGCQKESKTEKEIAKIPISFQLDRFDREFAQATVKNLPELREKYPFLFPKKYADSVWVNKIEDSVQQEINREVHRKFPDFDEEKEELRDLFRHLTFYYPHFDPPRVITMTSYVDYLHRVVLSDSLLFISLDNFLGSDHKFYKGIPRYFSERLNASQIIPDVAAKYARYYVPRPKKRSFLSYMVYYGKRLYFEEKMLPKTSAADLMGYTDKEIKWAQSNEKHIWSFFVEEDLLYKTDPDLRKRFFNIGPFTKFGLTLDNDSPSQLGRYIGWQIVKQFADKHKDLSLQELLQLNNKTLFEESNYKPRSH